MQPHIRHAAPRDRDQWPDEEQAFHAADVERFFAAPRGLGSMPEAGLVAVAENEVSATAHRALGFEEVVVTRCFRKSLGTTPP